jgi:putative ABC transport system permease protein
MKVSHFHIVKRSILYNLKGVVYQILIIILLTAVITGSLLTGKSVRKSLRQTSFEKLGNTGILVSSGLRYINPSLTVRLADKTGVPCTGITEINGYCQNFSTGNSAPGIKIYAVDDDFFTFHGNEETIIPKGEVAVNKQLADYIELEQGGELIIRFNPITDIPSDAPFSPGKDPTESLVLKVGKILTKSETGDFSLGISQLTPLNLFVNRSDITDSEGNIPKINRILFSSRNSLSVSDTYAVLANELRPEDIGFTVRVIPRTGGYELVSDRIFIDEIQLNEIMQSSLKCYPVITYLANSFTAGNRSAPYSFISALDPDLYSEIPDNNHIIINKWLAEDIVADKGDTLVVRWYSPDPMNRLEELDTCFIISRIVEPDGIWGDSLLMPEFPGIAGSASCTDWDAGVEINMDLIRNKDEDYWNRYRGTPKAFINYSIGKDLWGNNFGPVTSLRFDPDVSSEKIHNSLSGSFDPYKSGFSISDLPHDSAAAASEGVDFSTLFLSLGFFIIFSAILLLVLLVTSYYESKKKQLKTLFSIGFPNRKIERIMLLETGLIAFIGAIAGTFAGGLFNIIMIRALNSVWKGAVQTNALISGLDPLTLLIGFIITLAVILTILKIKSFRFLLSLNKPETGKVKRPSQKKNFIAFIAIAFITTITGIFSFTFTRHITELSFTTGILLFSALILLLRQYYLAVQKSAYHSFNSVTKISSSYFSFNPSQAIAPVLFLAAGLFALIITGVNRVSITDSMLKPSGGTGGFQLWGESSVPVEEEITGPAGRIEFGLDDNELKELQIIEAKRTQGNDASCLNLNHITSPPLLGIDPSVFVTKGSFSFASVIKGNEDINPWLTLDDAPVDGTIYGIADQTVLEYGLKIKTGDTLKIRAESGQILNIVISAGLQSSVFQGYVLIGKENLNTFFPSVAGSQVFLAEGKPESTELYIDVLNQRLNEYGVHFQPASEKLASFFVVTNTYLSVFTILGGIGMILGVIGLGFILIRNFNQRKRDFGLMMAAGFSIDRIRKMIFGENSKIFLAGIITGVVPALIATRPSISNESGIPWKTIILMICLILITGFTVIGISVRTIKRDSLVTTIRKE